MASLKPPVGITFTARNENKIPHSNRKKRKKLSNQNECGWSGLWGTITEYQGNMALGSMPFACCLSLILFILQLPSQNLPPTLGRLQESKHFMITYDRDRMYIQLHLLSKPHLEHSHNSTGFSILSFNAHHHHRRHPPPFVVLPASAKGTTHVSFLGDAEFYLSDPNIKTHCSPASAVPSSSNCSSCQDPSDW